ncbi:uncharacterized protein LOC120536180 [Polypterus senegalus]|uniref:uncharacterized protein LOC120536180 n=1 Tax=Polypterus senegalus TaxID=55291 RepID=UPI0019664D25|nr:uncharacterized protein LOC120536180 [Polypterus senegalus]
MENTSVVFILLLSVTEAKFSISMPQSELISPLHTNVLLPCFFTLANSKHGLKYVIVTWKQNNIELAKYREGKVKSTSKVTLLESQLQRGNASLLIKNVTVGDEGHYLCEVYEVPNLSKGSVQLRVTVPPVVSLNPPMAEKGKSVTLKCHVEKFYPEVISIRWKRGTKCLDSQEPSKISRNPEGTFSAMSFYNYTSIYEGLSENISCIVKHQSKEGHKVEIPLQICKPTLTVPVKTLHRGKKQKVMCKLQGCLFNKATVSLKRNGKTLSKSQCWDVKQCVSKTEFVPSTSDGKMHFTCEAVIEGLNTSVAKHVTFIVEDLHDPEEHWYIITVIIMIVAFCLLYVTVHQAYQGKEKRSFIMSDIEVIMENYPSHRITLNCCLSGNQYELKRLTWRIKWKSLLFKDISFHDTSMVQSIKSNKLEAFCSVNSTHYQRATLLQNHKLCSVTFVPKAQNVQITVQCQVAIVILGRTQNCVKTIKFIPQVN